MNLKQHEIIPRRALISHLRVLFESTLCGVLYWDEVKLHEPELAPLGPKGGRNLLGKFKQQVVVTFGESGEFMLDVESPDSEPPLGWVKLYYGGSVVSEGPLDIVIWDNIGEAIKQRCKHG